MLRDLIKLPLNINSMNKCEVSIYLYKKSHEKDTKSDAGWEYNF